MVVKFAVLAVAAVLTATAPAIGATFDSVNGRVTASSGGGFQQVASGTQVQPGQRVNVSQGGSARITYDNGCTLVLDQPGLYDVPTDPNCAGGAPGFSPAQIAIGAAVAVGVGVIIYQATKSSSP